jgi:hypothetical protein
MASAVPSSDTSTVGTNVFLRRSKASSMSFLISPPRRTEIVRSLASASS